jgi:hypothetical protein
VIDAERQGKGMQALCLNSARARTMGASSGTGGYGNCVECGGSVGSSPKAPRTR